MICTSRMTKRPEQSPPISPSAAPEAKAGRNTVDTRTVLNS